MTQPDEPPRDGTGDGASRDGAPSDGAPLDEDAAWRAIVENYGERADLGVGAEPTSEPPAPEPPAPRPSSVFDRSFLEAAQAEREGAARDDADASWHDEGHFVPPEPPPMPRGTPARRIAWASLFGAPVLMLLAVVLGWSYPPWFSLLLVVSFVGGFVFLVATMERHGDDWSGDDGAVV